MKRILFAISVALIVAVLAVTVSATTLKFDLEDAVTDNGQAVNKIVATLIDDGDFRAIKMDFLFDNTMIIPVAVSDGSVPNYSEAANAPFIWGDYEAGTTTDITIVGGPNWVINGANSTVGFESYWSQLENYPIDCTDGFVLFEMYFKFAEGKSKSDITANTFKPTYVKHTGGQKFHFIGNSDTSLNDIVLINNVVLQGSSITINVVAGDIVYFQDGTFATAEVSGAYEVPAIVGYVAVNTGKTEQKTYYIDGTTATEVHLNGAVGSDTVALRDRTAANQGGESIGDKNGIRFKMTHNPEARGGEHAISELGFIMTAESNKVINAVGKDYVLNMDMVSKGYAKVGKAYASDGSVTNYVFNMEDDEAWDIRAVFYNIPISESGVQTVIACRPYYKVGDSYIYGEVTKNTLYNIANAIKGDDEKWNICADSMKEYIDEIIFQVIQQDEVIINIKDLYN